MSEFVVTDYFVGRPIVDDFQLATPDNKCVEPALAFDDFLFTQRKPLKPIAYRSFDGIRDTLTGPFSEGTDHLVGVSIIDENGHRGPHIYSFEKIYTNLDCDSTIL
jgi:hypothetical protein